MNQPSQESLTQILQNALSGNDSLRKEAESQITRLEFKSILNKYLIYNFKWTRRKKNSSNFSNFNKKHNIKRWIYSKIFKLRSKR